MKTLSELTWSEIKNGIIEAWKNTNEKDSSSLGVHMISLKSLIIPIFIVILMMGQLVYHSFLS